MQLSGELRHELARAALAASCASARSARALWRVFVPFEVGWEMRSSLIAIWVTDYKLPRGVNDKLRDN